MRSSFRKNLAISALVLSMLPATKVDAEETQGEVGEATETEHVEEIEQVQTEQIVEEQKQEEQVTEEEQLTEDGQITEEDTAEEAIEAEATMQIMMASSMAEYNVLSQRNVHYAAKVIQPWSINSEPWGTSGSETVIEAAHELVGKTVEVIQEKTTEKSTYALIQNGSNVIGWIDTTGLHKHVVTATKDVNYVVDVTQPWSINSQPWGVEGFKTVDNGQNYIGQSLNVVQEKITDRSTYLLLKKDDQTIGWIDETGVNKHSDILSVKHTTYA